MIQHTLRNYYPAGINYYPAFRATTIYPFPTRHNWVKLKRRTLNWVVDFKYLNKYLSIRTNIFSKNIFWKSVSKIFESFCRVSLEKLASCVLHMKCLSAHLIRECNGFQGCQTGLPLSYIRLRLRLGYDMVPTIIIPEIFHSC